jgi:hypothetical protein
MHEPPPVNGPAGAGIPDVLRPVLLRALAKERGDRYATAADLVEALRQARGATLGTADQRTTPAPLMQTSVTGTAPATPIPFFTPAPPPPAMPTVVNPPAAAPPPWATAPPRPEASAVRTDTTPTPIPPATQAPRRSPPPLRRIPPESPGIAAPEDETSGSRRAAVVVGLAAVLVLGTVGVVGWRAASSRSNRAEAPPSASPPVVAESPSPTTSPTGGTLGSSGSLGSGGATAASPSPSVAPRAPSPSPSVRVARASPEAPVVPPPPDVVPDPTGFVQVVVKPWAEVFVDNRSVGTTPLRKLTLPVGNHTVRLVHPGFKPLQRLVKVKAGETATLEVNLSWEAVPVGSQ